MRVCCVICLLALVAVGPQLHAQVQGDKLTAALAENKMLKKLVVELTAMTKQLNAELLLQRVVVEKIKKDHLKTATGHQKNATEYKLAMAENKMLKARIKSLLRSGDSSTSKPAAATRDRRNVRLIAITLHEELWKWWTDPQLLSEHILLRRKLVHLDGDHSIDAWLVRRKEFAGTRVDWPMELVSGSIISKKKVDAAWKKAKQDLNDTLNAMVYGKGRTGKTDNARIVDRRIAAGATSRPAIGTRRDKRKAKTPKNTAGPTPRRVDFRKRIRNLQEQIELYKTASAAGGMTTIHAVAGNIAVKMSLPGRRFEKVSVKKRPSVQVTGNILSAAPKAGFFAGRKDSMIQFVVAGECKMKNPPAPKTSNQ
ncbi:MAG: hypothetical protein QGH60_06165 [Phycisphaerae bacterium]|jgi:hypothetical protein|nr:hypothetical protein [Phycisphaerae bacterium]